MLGQDPGGPLLGQALTLQVMGLMESLQDVLGKEPGLPGNGGGIRSQWLLTNQCGNSSHVIIQLWNST